MTDRSPRARLRPLACTALLVPIALGIVARIAGIMDVAAPRWSFTQTMPVELAAMLERGDVWRQWLPLLRTYQCNWIHESAVMMPVAMAFQRVLGPSFHLPAVVGALFGTLAIVFAWAFGRAYHSPFFGLVFAGLVAVAPLQIVWSRLGGLFIGAPAHVLIVLWLGLVAGKRQSAALAFLTGATAWLTLYHYFAARPVIVLAPVAVLAGLVASRARAGRAVVVLVMPVVTLAAIYVLAGAPGLHETLWPHYAGYVGNRQESGGAEWVRSALAMLPTTLPRAIRVYFWQGRGQIFGATALMWRFDGGGLCLAPVVVLGVLGLPLALRSRDRGLLLFATAVLGLLVPTLSAPTARRFLLFDVAWCAFAAHGLVAAASTFRRWRYGAAAAVLVALGVGAAVTITTLDGRLRPSYTAPIPFAESGFGDGTACLACLRAGFAWQRDIEAGAFVVLFDSDADRETVTAPGGLRLYGKTAALAAGRSSWFLDYYALVANAEDGAPHPGRPLYDPASGDFAAFLAGRIEDAHPATIVWEFAQPTQWERWVADELEAAGGTRLPAPFPSALPDPFAFDDIDEHPFRIVTPWDRRAAAFALFHRLATVGPAGCMRIEEVDRRATPDLPLILAGAADGGTEPAPVWTVGSWRAVYWAERRLPIDNPIAVATSADRIDVLTTAGIPWTADVDTGEPAAGRPVGVFHIGLRCAALVGGDWWVVSPISGRLTTSARPERPIPAGRWVGIARRGHGEVLLADADQSVHVFDAASGRALARFPAAVMPSRRTHFAECIPVLAGEGWMGTYDVLRAVLAAYDADGKSLGRVALDLPATAIDAAGSFLAVGGVFGVRTYRVGRAPGCGP